MCSNGGRFGGEGVGGVGAAGGSALGEGAARSGDGRAGGRAKTQRISPVFGSLYIAIGL